MANKSPWWQLFVIEQRQCRAFCLNVLVVFVLLILLISGCGLQGAGVPTNSNDQDNTGQQDNVGQQDNSNTPKVSETIINGKA